MNDIDKDQAGGFFASSVSRPVATFVLFVTMLVIGVITYRDIPLEMLPDGWSTAQLNMHVASPDSSARENEEKVARVIEEQLRTLSGIEEVYSRSNDTSVYFRIKFNAELNIDAAKAEVRDRVERARPLLPTNVDEISMWSEDASQMPLAMFGLLHKGDGERTDFLIDKIVKPRLEATRGVANLEMWGGGADSMRILLDEDQVFATGLDIGALISRLTSDNFTEPMGEVPDGGKRILMRSDMRFSSPEEIENFPIGNGLRISDVGRVEKVKSLRNSVSKIDGQYSYFAFASKDSQVNIVEASQNFKKTIEELEADPRINEELSFVPFFIPGDMVETSLSQLQETAAYGGLLAMVVLFIFLRRVRMTLCIALSIPVSALMAIAVEYFQGSSFNILTMAGVTLAIGMLVDNSVVVVENITRFHDKGMPGVKAARNGAREIALAVTLATLTTVVVFLPMMFISEHPVLRLAFTSLGQPLCVSLVFSLLIALVFLPVIAGRILGTGTSSTPRLKPFFDKVFRIPARLVAHIVAGLRAAFFGLVYVLHHLNRYALYLVKWMPARVLLAAIPLYLAQDAIRSTAPAIEVGKSIDPMTWGQAAQALPGLLILLALIASAAILFLLPRIGRRVVGAPTLPSQLVPEGNSIIEMVTTLNRILVSWTMEHRLLATGVSAVCFITILIPVNNSEFAAFLQEEDTSSVTFRVRFDADYRLSEASREMAVFEDYVEERRERYEYEHWESRFDDRGGSVEMYWDKPIPPDRLVEIRQELKAEMPDRPGMSINFYDDQEDGRKAKNVAYFSLRGPDSEILEGFGREAIEILKGVKGLTGVRSPLDNAPETLQVEIDRDMAQTMGVSAETAVNTISYTLRGWPLTRYHEEGREIPLIIEFDEEKIAGVGTLRDMTVFTPEGRVPLSSFSNLSVTEGDRTIRRRNGQATFNLSAEIEDPTRVMATTHAGNLALSEQLDLPRGYSIGDENDLARRQEDEAIQMQNALLLAVVLVFLLMGILFESVLLPFSVLFTIPFAILGAMWTIFLTGIQMDFMGYIGMIILAGVVVNNGIVLIDRIHRLTASGMVRTEAVIMGCGQRVRPVLMTALTTVFGLLPMAIAEPATNVIAYRALATIVAGGLVISTFFTLWVVPLAYTVFDDLSELSRARFRWWLRPFRTREQKLSEVPG